MRKVLFVAFSIALAIGIVGNNRTIRVARALEEAAGAWTDEAHQDLSAPKDMDVYLSDIRGSSDARLKRMLAE